MKRQTLIPYFIAVLFAILFFRQCDKVRESDKQAENIQEFLNDSVTYYKNELDQEIAVKNALQGDKDALSVLLSKQVDSTGQLKRLIKGFKKVDAAGNIVQITKIDTIYIPYDSTVLKDGVFQGVFNVKSQYYSISGRAQQEGLTIDNLEIPNTLSFAIGKKKKGMFNYEYVIEAVNSNPNIKNTGLDSYSVKVPQKRLGVTVLVGYGLSKDGLTPVIGFGVGYQLVRF